jgi:hypothetical protein
MLVFCGTSKGDTIALESLGGKGFGPVRMMGSSSYATVSSWAGAGNGPARRRWIEP